MQQLGQEPVALSELDGRTDEDFYGTYFSKAKKFDAQRLPSPIMRFRTPV